MTISPLKPLLRNTILTPYIYFLFIFAGFSLTAQAQTNRCPDFQATSSVRISATTPSPNGSFSIMYGGASTPTASTTVTVILYECAGASVTPMQRGTLATSTGTFPITGKAPGDYYYTIQDCVYPYHNAPSCYKTAVQNVLVTIPSNLNMAGETYEYDALGRINSVKVESIEKTNYQYDKAGNRKAVTEP